MCTTLRPTLMLGTRTVAFQPLALVKSTSLPLTLTVRFNGNLLGPGRAVLTLMPFVRFKPHTNLWCRCGGFRPLPQRRPLWE